MKRKTDKFKKRIQIFPELVLGVSAGIGAKLDILVNELQLNIEAFGFKVVEINLGDMLKIFKSMKGFEELAEIKNDRKSLRLRAKIKTGNFLRKKIKDNAVMARLAIAAIYCNRLQLNEHSSLKGVVYIVNQLKTPDEFKLLRRVYSRSFMLIGAYEDKNRRESRIVRDSENLKEDDRKEISKLIEDDYDEKILYGQKVSDIFTEAHIFVDIGEIDEMKYQVKRFVNIIFDYPFHTPSIDERCMFLAKGLAGRSADLGRQVGAVIADDSGDILAVGCNDVPKVGGGLYWEGDVPDLRDFQIEYDPNKEMLKAQASKSFDVLSKYLKFISNYELGSSLSDEDEKICERFEGYSDGIDVTRLELKKRLTRNSINIDKILDDPDFIDDYRSLLSKTPIFDSLEFSRCLHAEMSAISDAARRGIALRNTTLYCTTYPCHLCAKLILGVGIKRVVFIDPFPKSKAKDLFSDSISTYGEEFSGNKLNFEPFIGIAPRRYLHFFVRRDDKRKNSDGSIPIWPSQNQNLLTHFTHRFTSTYLPKEIVVISDLREKFKNNDIVLKEKCSDNEIMDLILNKLNFIESPEEEIKRMAKNIVELIGKEIKYL